MERGREEMIDTWVRLAAGIILGLIAIFLLLCGPVKAQGTPRLIARGHEQRRMVAGLKFECGPAEPRDRSSFAAAYERAMRDVPGALQPAMTTVHCDSREVGPEGLKIKRGAAQDDIYLARSDLEQFARSVSVLALLRRMSARLAATQARTEQAARDVRRRVQRSGFKNRKGGRQ